MENAKILDEATRRILAVRASVDPRTIQKVFDGQQVKGMAGYRALAALKAAGLAPRRGIHLVGDGHAA